MPDNDTFHSGGQNRFDGFCKQYGKYAFFVNKWWDASPDFMEIQEKDFRVQEFLHRMDSPTREAYLMDGRLFACLPRKSRIVYALYYGDGISLPELAEMFRTTTEKIEKMANTIRRILRTEELHLRMLHNFVKHELRIAHHSYVGSLKLAMHLFPDHPNVKALKDSGVNLADKFPVFGESLSAQLPHAVGGVAETVKAEVQQVSQVVETVANGHVAETVATGAGTILATLSKSLSAILMALAMPFLWIMSVLLCGKILGTALVREAPSISIRRWLTKHLFISYSGMTALPVIFIIAAFIFSYITVFDSNQFMVIVAYINALYFFLGVVYIGWLNRRYASMVILESKDSDSPEIPFEPIAKVINCGIWMISILLYGAFILVLVETVMPGIQQSINESNWNKFRFLCACILVSGLFAFCVLKSMSLLFQYCLAVSKDEESAKITPLPLDSVNGSWRLNMIRELVYTWPFMFVTLFPSLVRLFRQARTGDAVTELVLFIPWWCAVLYCNAKSPKYRWKIIIGTLILQLCIKELLRHVI